MKYILYFHFVYFCQIDVNQSVAFVCIFVISEKIFSHPGD